MNSAIIIGSFNVPQNLWDSCEITCGVNELNTSNVNIIENVDIKPSLQPFEVLGSSAVICSEIWAKIKLQGNYVNVC